MRCIYIGREFSIRTFYLNRHLSVANLDILGNVRSVAFLITLCALALIPSLLMALQPMKLEWILSGSSRRYAFSLYEWLAFVMLSSIFIKHSPLGKSIAVLVGLSVIATVMLLNSVFNNLKFTDSYADSLNNWRSLNKAILRSEGNPPRN
jgi:hypothetical protein